MLFVGSRIAAGPEWPSVRTGIFSYQPHCFHVFIFFFYFYH